MRLIGKCNDNEKNKLGTVMILDSRPRANAVGNQFQGKGYEDVKNYKNCKLIFCDIENIHHVTKCFDKMCQIGYKEEKWRTKNWLS